VHQFEVAGTEVFVLPFLHFLLPIWLCAGELVGRIKEVRWSELGGAAGQNYGGMEIHWGWQDRTCFGEWTHVIQISCRLPRAFNKKGL
jgi:hypothetical protein